jgi:hypothetical protein
MLSRVENNILQLINPINDFKLSIDVSFFSELEMYCMDKTNENIAISGLVDGENCLFVMNLGEKRLRKVFEGEFHDFNWLNTQELILNNGKELIKVNTNDENTEALCKVSRITTAPMRLAANPNHSRIMGVYRFDKPFVYTIGNQDGIKKLPFRIRHYCWINNEEILYSNHNGIKRFNVVKGEKSNFIINIQQIKKIPGLKEVFSNYSFKDCSIHIEEPKFIGNLVYFKLEVFFPGIDTPSLAAVLSVDLEKTKGDVVFLSASGLFRDYEPLFNGQLLSVLGIRSDTEPELESKVLLNKEELKLDGYYPVIHSHMPSTLSLYQDYYESNYDEDE